MTGASSGAPVSFSMMLASVTFLYGHSRLLIASLHRKRAEFLTILLTNVSRVGEFGQHVSFWKQVTLKAGGFSVGPSKDLITSDAVRRRNSSRFRNRFEKRRRFRKCLGLTHCKATRDTFPEIKVYKTSRGFMSVRNKYSPTLSFERSPTKRA